MATKTWTTKSYPEEDKIKLNKMLEETKEARQHLDDLDKELLNNVTSERIKDIARRAVGYGNYLRKKLGVLTAAVKNVKANRYMEIKIECASNDITFVAAAASSEAEGYVGPLRTARDVVEAYTISADNIVSFARMILRDQQQEKQVEV